MVCGECRSAKVKCEGGTLPCLRCVRLSLDCIPHISKQGQGPKKRKKRDQITPAASSALPETSFESTLAEKATSLDSNHYGINCIVRQWVAFAITRRSLSLLGRAASLASKCGISMDQVICGESNFDSTSYPVSSAADGNHDRMMTFLADKLLKPKREQRTKDSPLRLDEIPAEMLEAIDCLPTASTSPEGRWVLIREMKAGTSRFYVSHKMEQDVVPWDRIMATWNANKAGEEVRDLWEPPESKNVHARVICLQLVAQKRPLTPPSVTRIKRTTIRLASGQICQVDCAVCYHIVNLDHSIVAVEYTAREELFAISDNELSFLDDIAEDLRAGGDKLFEMMASL